MKAMHVKTGRFVAVKMMKNLFDSQYSAKKLVSEIQILRKLTACPNNVFTTKLYDIIMPEMDVESEEDVSHLFLVMEFVSTDLNKLM